MFLSEEKISHLSHLILNQLKREKGCVFQGDEVQVLREIKKVFSGELKLDEDLDRRVRAKLESYSRRIIEGSSEWNVLYQKTFEEELKKRKRG
jgi:hypothetical protein